MISEEVNETVMEHILAGIEIISGRARGSHYLNVSTYFFVGLFLSFFPTNITPNITLDFYDIPKTF